MSYREGKVYKVALMSTGGGQHLMRLFEGQEQGKRSTSTAPCARRIRMKAEKAKKMAKKLKKDDMVHRGHRGEIAKDFDPIPLTKARGKDACEDRELSHDDKKDANTDEFKSEELSSFKNGKSGN